MVWLWLAPPAVSALALFTVLSAANLRIQPRPLVGVHGLRWRMLHGLWAPPGGRGLEWWAIRVALLFGCTYPLLALAQGIGALPPVATVACSVATTVVLWWIGLLAVAASPWWASEVVATGEGVRVTGRWPRTSTVLPWSRVREVRVTGRDLVIEGPEDLLVLPMPWGPKGLLQEVAQALESTRQNATAAPRLPDSPPPPELAALQATAAAFRTASAARDP